MKKIISFLILFFLPIFVLADTMFPVYAGYNAKVNSEDGVYLYDYTEDKLLRITDIHLDNDTKIYVKDEIEVTKNVYYGAVEYNCDSNGNCETYYINLNKIVKTGEDKVYSPDELNKEIKNRFGANNVSNLEKINKPAISIKKGLNIYNYPSYTAKKLSYTISLYEEFTAVSFIPKNGEGIDAWFYIKNSKIEGWVNYKDGLAYNKQGTYEFTSEMQTYKDMECENESSYSVPSDSTLKGSNVYQLLLHSVEETYKDDLLLVRYKNSYYWVDGFFEDDDDAQDYEETEDTNDDNDSDEDVPETVICLEDTDYYTSRTGKSLGKIPIGTELKVVQIDDSDDEEPIYNVYYKDDIYLVKGNSVSTIDIEEECYTDITITKKTKYYDKIGGTAKGTIPEYTKLCETGSAENDEISYLYVEYKGKKYWINGENSISPMQPVLTIKETDLYDSVGGKVVKKAKANEIIYYYKKESNHFLIEYEDKYYWVETKEVLERNSSKVVTLEETTPVYDSLFGEKIESPVKEKAQKYNISYSYEEKENNEIWYFVPFIKKWVKESDLEVKPVVDDNETKEEPEVIAVENGISNKTKIIISIFSSVIIAVSAVVSIILINKMRKSKEVDNNEKVD